MSEQVLLALGMSAVAGLSTGVGGALVAFAKGRQMKLLAGGLGLGAGVMIYVSFVEMFPAALDRMGEARGEEWAEATTTLAFFAGVVVIALIDCRDWQVGVPVTVAIALHNVPEGVAVAIPVPYATGSPSKAFSWAFLSGLAEPIGAFIGWFSLRAILDEVALGVSLASVAGIMVFISLDQLIPNSRRYDAGHVAVYGLIGGMAIMALTLVLL